ncbi:MAG: pyridoxal-phosphate dependent enzyme [Bdellovibrionales bacterium]|nr:pyridoxal-phosphate dependent enzyme [Bdellovibrionales bacterium]
MAYVVTNKPRESMQSHSLLSPYLQSRVHPLKYQESGKRFFLKRDDELSFGISGSKLRKYHSLIPFLNRNEIQEAWLIGSRNSNNLVGLAQKLTEEGIPFKLFLCGPKERQDGLNYQIIKSLWPTVETHWIASEKWPRVATFVDQLRSAQDKRVAVIPEGAFMSEALSGAMSLADDILRNQKEWNRVFDHIFIDSGTGLSAAALYLRLRELNVQTPIHVIQLYGNPDEFYKSLDACHHWLNKKRNLSQTDCNQQTDLYVSSPTTAKSFGARNQTINNFIQKFAETEGVLLDPIYSAKLIHSSLEIARQKSLKGSLLMIHSGGGFSLLDHLASQR